MEHRRAGRSGLALSVLALSARRWGRETDTDDAAAILATFRDYGGTFVDAGGGNALASNAGGSNAGGRAESVLGALLAGDRDAMTVATSSSRPAGRAATSRAALLTGLTDSLRRLRCDHVDLWQLPAAEPGVPYDESLAALDTAVASGKVRYAGACEPSAWRLARASTWQAAWPGRTPLVTNQVAYSLLDRGIELDVAQATAELGLGLICRATLAGGLLTGRSGESATGATFEHAGNPESSGPRAAGIVEAVATAADGLATTAPAISLSWLRHRPGVTSLIIGARKYRPGDRRDPVVGPDDSRGHHRRPGRGIRAPVGPHVMRHRQRTVEGLSNVAVAS